MALTHTTARQSRRLDESRDAFVDAILAGNRRRALGIVEETVAGTGYLPVLEEVVASGQERVGKLWEQERITVADEHLATGVTQFVLSAMLDHLPPRAMSRGDAVLCGVTGDQHQIPLQIVADALEADGWRVRLLGTGLTAADLVPVLERRSCKLLGIGASLPEHCQEAQAIAAVVKERLGPDAPHIMFGGRGFQQLDGPPRVEGVTVVSSVRAGVIIARGLPGLAGPAA